MTGPILDPSRYDTLTFDCYGTLVDWERTLLDYIHPILAQHDIHVVDDFVLEYFAQVEAELQAGSHSDYRIVLEDVISRFGKRLGFTPSGHNLVDFPYAVATAAPFPDTVPALEALATRFDLAIVSNTDDDLFVLTQPLLGVEFAHIVTAKQVKAYKPDRRMFEAAIERCGVPKERLLHVAQSIFHDIAPTNALGIDNVWINRRAGRSGGGATRMVDARPKWEFPDLASFVAAVIA